MSLKDQTKDLHEKAEKNPFAQRLLSGNISNNEYLCYLTNLILIYSTIESIAQNNGLLKDIESIKRTQHIRNDQEELLTTATCTKILPSTIKYTEYLLTVKGHNILAHLYTRHFGDLYGGQIIKSKVPGSGTMYQFDNRKELIDKTRMMLTDDLGPESRTAFIYAIQLFEDLSHEFNL
jgi:heme oxygenase